MIVMRRNERDKYQKEITEFEEIQQNLETEILNEINTL